MRYAYRPPAKYEISHRATAPRRTGQAVSTAYASVCLLSRLQRLAVLGPGTGS